jgi:hypothetical protein
MTLPNPALTATGLSSHVSASVIREAGEYREKFLTASPFKHVMIEDFFESNFAERLLQEFPSFDPKWAVNEEGRVGGKSANPEISEISPAYRELYDAISSQPFLDLVTRLTGIEELILDPRMFGGGTHENLHGQELDVHVDFNYDEAQQLHRRVNLIVYLNKGWKTEWGGAIELHSNPRRPEEDRFHSFDPLFNRCVLFETNEYSWHGFPRINLPPDQRHLSRKSISIYLYTKDRPAHEIVPMHGTFYCQRPLPGHIRAGHTLTQEDVDELRRLLIKRDAWIEHYHKMEIQKNREIAERNLTLKDLAQYARVPLTGYVLHAGPPTGVFPDEWSSSHAEIPIQPLAPLNGLLLRAWRPDGAPPARIRLSALGKSAEMAVQGGTFDVRLTFPRATPEPFVLMIDTESSGRAVSSNIDHRDLQFRISELRAQHPLVDTFKKNSR